MIDLPPPYALGLPAKFTEWRPDQVEAFQLILDSPTRFVGLTMPTGSGKSLTYAAAQVLYPGRSVVLTATKGLQDQVGDEFPGLNWDLRGQRNYPCKALEAGGEWGQLWSASAGPATCEDGPCHAGAPCTLKEAGCLYYDKVRQGQGQHLITNYALWMAQRKYGQGLGKADLLVLDEAHQAFDELAAALSIKIERWLFPAVGIDTLPANDSLHTWKDWARFHGQRLRKKLEHLGKPTTASELKYRRRLKAVERNLTRLEAMEVGNWVPDHTDAEVIWEVLHPAQWAEELLFQGAQRVVLLSATLTPKTLSLLGIKEATVWECPSRFPVARRPVYFIPTCKVDGKMKQEHWTLWVSRHDQIIGQRPQTKGLIHTVSYQRRDRLVARSDWSSRFLLHGNKPGEVAQAVARFKKLSVPQVLVSPSLTTGWDFPHDQCRWQIVSKLPFPDTRSAVMKARCELDKELLYYLTAQTLVQTVGRGMRDATDWCETFIIDDHWRWFIQHRHLMPQWFLAAVRTSQLLPKPLHQILGVAA